MYVYIDESGDVGTRGRGSRWLVFGCAMIADSDFDEIKSAVEGIRNRVDPQKGRYLHFRDIPHDDKIGALNLLAGMKWTGIVVANDTNKTPTFNQQLNYDLTAVHVIELALTYAMELRESAIIYFENSRALRLVELRSHVRLMLRKRDITAKSNSYRPIHMIEELRKGDAQGLDIADGVAHAAFRALEPNRKWGHLEPRYLNIIAPRLWRGPANAGLEGWGLTLTPTELLGDFREEYPWLL